MLRRWVYHRALLAECVREVRASFECRHIDKAQGQSSNVDAMDLSEETHAFVLGILYLSQQAISTQADVVERCHCMIERSTAWALWEQRCGNTWTHVSSIREMYNEGPNAMNYAVNDQLCEDHGDFRQSA